MTLAELSVCYEEAAVPLRRRLRHSGSFGCCWQQRKTRRKSGAVSAAVRN